MGSRSMPRYSLRTLLILLAIGPPLVAWWAWPWYLDYRNRVETKHTVEQYILRLRSDASPPPYVRLGQGSKIVFDPDGDFHLEPIGPQP
jgi:hypothetical protein